MNTIPFEIQKLIEERDALRKRRKYREADAIRMRIQKLGYTVIDEENETRVLKIAKETTTLPKQSFLVLFGSGEISSTGARIHDHIFQRIGKDEISIALISTPAGFQPNVKAVYEEIGNFFLQHLQNYHPKIEIIYANTRRDANTKEILKPLETADYIFTGPGSPTYAVRHLKNTLLYRKIAQRVKEGATLSLASAATIAFSHFALPVYEIYKVGEPLHWIDGLDFYSRFYERMTIIPHFNNKEGGEKNDTSCCFMGQYRCQQLLQKLPKTEKVLGIDEHTAAIIDLKAKQLSFMGKGRIHELRSKI